MSNHLRSMTSPNPQAKFNVPPTVPRPPMRASFSPRSTYGKRIRSSPHSLRKNLNKGGQSARSNLTSCEQSQMTEISYYSDPEGQEDYCGDSSNGEGPNSAQGGMLKKPTAFRATSRRQSIGSIISAFSLGLEQGDDVSTLAHEEDIDYEAEDTSVGEQQQTVTNETPEHKDILRMREIFTNSRMSQLSRLNLDPALLETQNLPEGTGVFHGESHSYELEDQTPNVCSSTAMSEPHEGTPTTAFSFISGSSSEIPSELDGAQARLFLQQFANTNFDEDFSSLISPPTPIRESLTNKSTSDFTEYTIEDEPVDRNSSFDGDNVIHCLPRRSHVSSRPLRSESFASRGDFTEIVIEEDEEEDFEYIEEVIEEEEEEILEEEVLSVTS